MSPTHLHQATGGVVGADVGAVGVGAVVVVVPPSRRGGGGRTASPA